MSEAFLGTKLTMNLGARSYDIILRRGALQNLYQFANLNRRVAVVTDSGVPPLYARQVADQCREATIITVPQGRGQQEPENPGLGADPDAGLQHGPGGPGDRRGRRPWWETWPALRRRSICGASTSSTAPPPPCP